MTKEEFIKRAQEKFKDRFTFKELPERFRLETTRINVICKTHGCFSIIARNFIDSRLGCRQCYFEERRSKAKSKLSEIVPDIPFNPILDPIVPDKGFIIGTVYLIVNKINNKKYIGETVRRSYKERLIEHSVNCTKIQNYFYKAILKYGWDNFDKYVLFQTEIREETKENKKILNDIVNLKGREYIAYFQSSNSKYGYNLTEGGDGISGYAHTEENKKKFSENRKGEKHWNYGRKNSAGRKILQFDLDFNFIKEWPSAREIQRELNISASMITNCCRGRHNRVHGFIFVYKDTYYDGYFAKLNKPVTIVSNDKIIYGFDIEGNKQYEFSSATEAARFFKCSSSNIGKAATGSSISAKNHVWIYAKDFTPQFLQQKLERYKTILK